MLVACGSPKEASKPDFCTAYHEVWGPHGFDQGDQVARRLWDTGAPKEIDHDAREGFKLFIGMLLSSISQADLESRIEAAGYEDNRKVVAFRVAANSVCS